MTENTDTGKSDQTKRSDAPPEPIDPIDRSSCRETTSTRACDACDTTHYVELHEVSLGNTEYEVCSACLQLLVDQVERHYWWERLNEAQYNRAAEFLRSLGEVWCVKDQAYAGGELWVHTPYCDAAVVRDVCDHFGFQIRWFSVVTPSHEGFDCVSEHGPCIEINLIYTNRISNPLPLEYDIQDDVRYHEVDWLDTHHRLFDLPGDETEWS
jgi:hypothetical protein